MILIINQNHQSELVASSLVIIPNLHMPIKKYTIHQQKDKVVRLLLINLTLAYLKTIDSEQLYLA